MRSIAVLIALLFSTSTLAFAQPKREKVSPRDETSSGRLVLDKTAAPRKRLAPRQVDGWTELADATPTKFGTVFVMVGGAQTGTFTTLRVEASSGKVAVRRVRVYFTDGKDKTFPVSKTLDSKRRKATYIDLGGYKEIERIVVTTVGSVRGEYTIHGTDKIAPARASCC